MIGPPLGPYRIVSELGAGGMGTVYRAETQAAVHGFEAGASVALKVIHPQLLASPGFFKRFLREAELGRSVRHENVVRTIEADALLSGERQVHFMVLEYVEGKSLRRLLEELGRVPETLLREIAEQTAAGLAAIHAKGIVHRDLKPENVLLSHDHRVRVMDLGVAKLQEASVVLTREGQFTGSLLYAAPEQFQGREVGPAADLYSLGVILYELATGAHPFARDTAASIIHAHLHGEPPSACDAGVGVSPFLGEVIATLLRKAPSERIESAAALRELIVEAERSSWWAEREASSRARGSGLPRILVDRETHLHGREQDLRTLRDAWTRASAGEGGVVLMVGEPGIGKTRILDALVREVASEGGYAP
jgi:eukaryotic-like serine/threonine-protein kinase